MIMEVSFICKTRPAVKRFCKYTRLYHQPRPGQQYLWFSSFCFTNCQLGNDRGMWVSMLEYGLQYKGTNHSGNVT